MRDALGLALDQVYQWRLLLEEYGPKIVYVKGIHNTIVDTISRLEYDPSGNQTIVDTISRLEYDPSGNQTADSYFMTKVKSLS